MNWFLRQKQRERELEKELRGHLELEAAELNESGHSDAESYWAARRTLGNITQLKEEIRETWGFTRMEQIFQDLRFATRTFRANLNVTLTIVISLALGIGATCAMYSVIYGVLINTFIYKTPDRIIIPTYSEPDSDDRRPSLNYSSDDFLEMEANSRAFQDIISTDSDVLVTDGPSPANINVLSGSANFFEFFGTPPVMGRTFATGDVLHPENPPEIAVISYKLWISYFHGSRDVIGRDLKLYGRVYKVIGVMPLRFGWFDMDAFIPAKIRPGSKHRVSVFMRLRPGVSLSSASAELQSFTERFAKRDPKMYPKLPFHLYAVPFSEWDLGKLPGKLLILFGAVSLLLLVGCANVSILLLSRSAARTREISMRVALGASTARIFQQLLTESLLLAVAGCLIGILLAWRGVPALVSVLPENSIPHESVVTLNLHVLAFTVLISLITGVLFGLAPALALVRTTIHSVVQGGNRATSGGKGLLPLRTLLLLSEVALTTMLLVGAAIGLRNLAALYHADLGYNPRDVAVVDLGWLHRGKEPAETRQAFYKKIEGSLRTVAGVRNVTETLGAVPPTLGMQSPVSVAGQPENLLTASVGMVGSEYFSTLNTPIVKGRVFNESEVQQREHLTVVNTAFARLLESKGLNPLETLISIHGIEESDDGRYYASDQAVPFQIVGVVATIENQSMQTASKPAIYLPYTYELTGGALTFLIRTAGNPHNYEQAIQKQIRAYESPSQPVADFDDLQHILTVNALSDPQSGAILLTIFATFAMTLAAVGLYSAMSFSVAQRNKEIAIRMALGAQSAQVANMILSSTFAVTAAGIAIGLLAAFAFGKTLEFYEQGWQSHDLLAQVAVPALLLFVSLIATLVPTWKAISVSPSEALRSE